MKRFTNWSIRNNLVLPLLAVMVLGGGIGQVFFVVLVDDSPFFRDPIVREVSHDLGQFRGGSTWPGKSA